MRLYASESWRAELAHHSRPAAMPSSTDWRSTCTRMGGSAFSSAFSECVLQNVRGAAHSIGTSTPSEREKICRRSFASLTHPVSKISVAQLMGRDSRAVTSSFIRW